MPNPAQTRRYALVLFLAAGLLTNAVPTSAAAQQLPPGPTLRVCPAAGTPGCYTDSVTKALADVGERGTVVIAPGTYAQGGTLRANGVTIRGEPGAHLTRTAVAGKAALVIQGNDTVVEGLECSFVTVSDQNGACIRAEGTNLTVRRVHFRDSQNGILGGKGTTLIEDSTFERLGAGGQAHGMYILGGELIVRRTKVLASKGEGHEVKTRTTRTVIEDCVIASLDGEDSRLLDASNGGEVIIRNSVLQEGPASANSQLIGVGYEGVQFEKKLILLENNIILMERPGSMQLIGSRDMPAPVLRGNTIIGGEDPNLGGNVWHKSRARAGLPPYPFLPAPPRR